MSVSFWCSIVSQSFHVEVVGSMYCTFVSRGMVCVHIMYCTLDVVTVPLYVHTYWIHTSIQKFAVAVALGRHSVWYTTQLLLILSRAEVSWLNSECNIRPSTPR